MLHGEVGMSETRELIAPQDSDTHVFQSNSRDTFLLTLPSSLGPIWKVSTYITHNRASMRGILILTYISLVSKFSYSAFDRVTDFKYHLYFEFLQTLQ